MPIRQIDEILERGASDSTDPVARARQVLDACVRIGACDRGQVWLWRVEPNGARRLDCVARVGDEWSENPLARPSLVISFGGGLEVTKNADGLHVTYLAVGSVGFLALGNRKAFEGTLLADLFQRARQLGEWLSGDAARSESDPPAASTDGSAMRGLLEQSALDRIAATSLASVRTVEELGRVIERFAERLFPIEYSGIYFIEPVSGQLRLVYAKGLTEAERRSAERTAPQRHPGQVIRSGLPVEVDDTSVAPDPNEPPGHGKLVRSRMYLPVRCGGGTVGAIGFASSQPASFSQRHHDALAFLCDLAGVTYARLRDHDEVARRGRMLEAAATANERLLVAIDWRASATSALALVGDALGVTTLALVKRQQHAANEQFDFIWQPMFGSPWPHRDRCACPDEAEVSLLGSGLALEIEPGPGAPRLVLKPVLVQEELWGVLAAEVDPAAAGKLGKAERAALRGLASGVAAAIDRERIDRELRDRQQIDAVSRLAGGIAHDFNNLLWPILLYSDTLERDPELGERTRAMVREIRRSASRASELVQQVFAVSRSRDPELHVVDVPNLAIEAAAAAKRGVPAEVRLHAAIDADAGRVLGDEDSVREILRTLLKVALEDAAKEAGGCEVEFAVTRQERDRGSWILLSVDRGARVLEVSPVRETALRRCVAGLGGELTGEARPGVAVLVPITLREEAPFEASGAAVPMQEETAAVPSPASECVLLVDDDSSVLEVARQIIESLGYEVVACNAPSAAIEVLRDSARPLALLLTDLAMPGMDGLSLAREARRLRPALPVVCCTGFGDARAEQTAKEIGVTAFIRKPIDFDRYAGTIRRAIDGADPASG